MLEIEFCNRILRDIGFEEDPLNILVSAKEVSKLEMDLDNVITSHRLWIAHHDKFLVDIAVTHIDRYIIYLKLTNDEYVIDCGEGTFLEVAGDQFLPVKMIRKIAILLLFETMIEEGFDWEPCQAADTIRCRFLELLTQAT